MNENDFHFVLHLVDVAFAGWGKKKKNDTKASDQLQIIQVKIVSSAKCQKTSFGGGVFDYHICAFAKRNVGGCDGDSGGPLVSDNKVVGVANFVRPCAMGVPDVYASVAHHYDWIKNKTSKA